MNVMDVFWILLMFVALQPMFKQRLLESSRARMLSRLERKRGSRVILLVHRQETMSLLGFPLLRYIDIHDSEEVMRAIHLTDSAVPIDLVLHTPGGLVLASMQIARAMRRHKGKVTVFVPHYAMSGGTLIALAADAIVMSEHAVLGPVDPQIGRFPAASLLNVVREKPIAEIDDETLILADQAEKAIRQVCEGVRDLLPPDFPEEKRAQFAKTLTEGRWTHDYAITPEAALEFGLPVSTAMPDEFVTLMNLYPQPVRRQPSVEYLPRPRRVGSPSGGRDGSG